MTNEKMLFSVILLFVKQHVRTSVDNHARCLREMIHFDVWQYALKFNVFLI
jgi:hypothetical protein